VDSPWPLIPSLGTLPESIVGASQTLQIEPLALLDQEYLATANEVADQLLEFLMAIQ
jgi:hypothetical protein